MSKIRVHGYGEVRSDPTTRSGTFDDGRDWSVTELEFLDEDSNKVMLRVPKGMTVSRGRAEVVIDIDTVGQSKGRCTLVSVVPVK